MAVGSRRNKADVWGAAGCGGREGVGCVGGVPWGGVGWTGRGSRSTSNSCSNCSFKRIPYLFVAVLGPWLRVGFLGCGAQAPLVEQGSVHVAHGLSCSSRARHRGGPRPLHHHQSPDCLLILVLSPHCVPGTVLGALHTSRNPHGSRTPYVPLSQMQKLRLSEVKHLAAALT